MNKMDYFLAILAVFCLLALIVDKAISWANKRPSKTEDTFIDFLVLSLTFGAIDFAAPGAIDFILQTLIPLAASATLMSWMVKRKRIAIDRACRREIADPARETRQFMRLNRIENRKRVYSRF